MPLARMMARSETFQERANSSPGLQAFLEKKGDEHAFSCLYLIAGIVCLYAAFTHGDEFCTAMSTADVGKPAETLAAAPHRRRFLLEAPVRATSKAAMAEMKGNMLDEEPAEAPADGAEADAASDAPADDAVADAGGEDAAAADSSDDARPDADHGEASKATTNMTFLGPQGWVVTWLTVEGFTALGLPLVSITLLLLRLHENACVSCVLYLVAVFQALWLIGRCPLLTCVRFICTRRLACAGAVCVCVCVCVLVCACACACMS
jgi:hypothetical protein